MNNKFGTLALGLALLGAVACTPKRDWVAAPLDQPMVDDVVVARIASEVALAAVERCPDDEVATMAQLGQYFTRPALGAFEREFLDPGYCDWYGIDTHMTGKPVITSTEVYEGAYLWNVEVPVTARYTSPKEQFDRHFTVQLELRRSNDLHVRRGVAVTSIRAERNG